MKIRIDETKVRYIMVGMGIAHQTDLATLAHLHANTINNALSGQNWTAKTLAGICCALQCEPAAILSVECSGQSEQAA